MSREAHVRFREGVGVKFPRATRHYDIPLNQSIRAIPVSPSFPCQTGSMLRLLRLLFVSFVRSFCSRRDLLLENLSLRQQLAVLKQRHPRPRFSTTDRLFWATLCRL